MFEYSFEFIQINSKSCEIDSHNSQIHSNKFELLSVIQNNPKTFQIHWIFELIRIQFELKQIYLNIRIEFKFIRIETFYFPIHSNWPKWICNSFEFGSFCVWNVNWIRVTESYWSGQRDRNSYLFSRVKDELSLSSWSGWSNISRLTALC